MRPLFKELQATGQVPPFPAYGVSVHAASEPVKKSESYTGLVAHGTADIQGWQQQGKGCSRANSAKWQHAWYQVRQGRPV
jgi:hypothetical protein